MTEPTIDAGQDFSARLVELEEEIALLRDELSETNRGVVMLYAEIEDKAEQVRNLADLKSRFLSYVSHEIRTPLLSMMRISRLLLDRVDGPLTDEQVKQVSFVNGAAQELFELVNDQLDLAKIEAGRLTVSPAWFEMVDLFTALRGMFKPILQNEAVSLIFEPPPESVVRLFSDDKKLGQILRNFISNALKFTVKGEVRVRATANDDATVTFAVSDTGIGIAESDLAALFEDFTQVKSAARRVHGTGLGLALSRRLARLLGGDVHATSVVGQGSTFSATIATRLPEQPAS